MYLTQDEFVTLSGIKLGLSSQQISKKFVISVNRVLIARHNLCKKYGVKSHWTELAEIADLKKVEVREENDIPFFQYMDLCLVQKIKINKADVNNLVKFFEQENDDEKEYELILNKDFNNAFNSLYIKNLETEKTEEIKNILGDCEI